MNQQMQFRSLMIFEDVNVMPMADNNPKVMLTQPVLNFIVPFLPTQLSFSIFAAVSHYEIGKKYDLEIRIINAIKNEMIGAFPWAIYQDQGDASIATSGLFISNIKNQIIETEGRYDLRLYCDNTEIGSCFFEVFKQERVNINVNH
ncbi:hypothetical protein [Paenibacillus vini]|uniref:hypothetical protein n=1 Tax=Paenibacillus vini TaxID=1476024 RepID=UPI001BCCD768|nr:hypothetical protein [Paenibacillus vini]